MAVGLKGKPESLCRLGKRFCICQISDKLYLNRRVRCNGNGSMCGNGNTSNGYRLTGVRTLRLCFFYLEKRQTEYFPTLKSRRKGGVWCQAFVCTFSKRDMFGRGGARSHSMYRSQRSTHPLSSPGWRVFSQIFHIWSKHRRWRWKCWGISG